MLLFVNDADHCLAAREPTVGERLLTYVWSGRLDRMLAAGMSPEGGALLALRAQQLVCPELRRELGRTVRDLVAQAWQPLPPRPALTAAVHQRAVRRSAEALGQLADCLLSPAPVSARGMAHTSVLISDPIGPFNYPSSEGQLEARIRETVLALNAMTLW